MHWAIRFSYLIVGASLIQFAVIWFFSIFGRFHPPFSESVQVLPVSSIALLYSVYSLMFPPASWAANGGAWSNQPVGEMFAGTALFMVPLYLIFPSDGQQLAEIRMLPSEYIWLILGVWPVHGIINAIHVHRVLRSDA